MATEIKLDRKHHERLVEIEAWCRDSIGLGSRRFVKNTWLGIEDWFYYEERVDQVEELTEVRAFLAEAPVAVEPPPPPPAP